MYSYYQSKCKGTPGIPGETGEPGEEGVPGVPGIPGIPAIPAIPAASPAVNCNAVALTAASESRIIISVYLLFSITI